MPQYAVIKDAWQLQEGEHALINGVVLVVTRISRYRRSRNYKVYGSRPGSKYQVSELVPFGGKVAVLVDIAPRKVESVTPDNAFKP